MRNKDGDIYHAMLNLHRVQIKSFIKPLRENIKYESFTLEWRILLNFLYKRVGKGIYIKKKHILENMFI